ncbi:rubrerythrin family protein [bacterium]|nr:rubrerythrin family protein [bacterium]
MRAMTETNLKDAFAGESQAHMKYLAFAEKAEKDGFPKVALLFRAISYAEQVHAHNHLKVLEGVGDTAANIQAAMAGEVFEVDEMYPAYDAVAALQEEKGALRSIHYALEAEKGHVDLYAEALDAVKGGNDIETESVYVCPVCGHTHAGKPEERCPVCNVPPEKYVAFHG